MMRIIRYLLALVALVAIQVPFAHAAKQVDLLYQPADWVTHEGFPNRR